MMLSIGFLACQPNTQENSTPSTQAQNGFVWPANADANIESLMNKFKAASVGIGVIRNGELVKTRYYGEQQPGVPVTANTMFNTASVHKAITSELVLRLASKGLIDLDEPLSPHYVHPDIKDDPRHEKLTARIALTHKTGFKNWEHAYEDGKLSFTYDPGAGYEYSGIGIMIMARAIEAKLNKPWPEIVAEHIYQPIGMKNVSSQQVGWLEDRVVIPVDEDGNFRGDIEWDIGYWNPSDDLYVTVEDYAKFLISAMNNEDLSPEMIAEKHTVQSDLTENEIWGCDGKVDPCPAPFGHSIGWFIYGYGDNLNIQHGGNDRSEGAIGYYETKTKNGMIVFVNSTQGVLMWPHVVDELDPDQHFTKVFHYLIAKYFTQGE